jgi:molybdopterin synthase sulfur carrier subunit
MATVFIPALLRSLTGGRDTVTAPGATVGEIVTALEAAYPGMRARLCDGDRLRPGLAVAVDGQFAPLGLLHTVGPTSEVHFLPALSGG